MGSNLLYLGKNSFQKIIKLAELELSYTNLLNSQNYMDAFLSTIGCKWVITEPQLRKIATYMVLKIVDEKKWVIGRLKYNL